MISSKEGGAIELDGFVDGQDCKRLPRHRRGAQGLLTPLEAPYLSEFHSHDELTWS